MPFARIGSLGNGCGIPLVMGDAGAARQATEHLLGLGHSRIGFIAGSPEYHLSEWRHNGWCAAMAAAGLPTEGLLAEGDFSYESGEAAARHLLQSHPRPTAIIACSGQMALATLAVAREMAIAVPGELSVISFDNSPAAMFSQPPLTAVDQPIAETASRAVELIIDAKKGETLPAGPTNIEACLIVRGSTGPASDRG